MGVAAGNGDNVVVWRGQQLARVVGTPRLHRPRRVTGHGLLLKNCEAAEDNRPLGQFTDCREEMMEGES